MIVIIVVRYTFYMTIIDVKTHGLLKCGPLPYRTRNKKGPNLFYSKRTRSPLQVYKYVIRHVD